VDPYRVLGVEPGADLDDIRQAYLAAARRSHPDFHDGDEASRRAAEDRMRELNLAWDALRDAGGRTHSGSSPAATGNPGPAPASTRSGAGEPWRPHDPAPSPGFDERHDRPITGGGIPGWLRLAPPGAFVAGIGGVVLGGVTGILPLVAAGVFSLLASIVLFVLAPLVALTSSHEAGRNRESR
jgi:hypothetical protein